MPNAELIEVFGSKFAQMFWKLEQFIIVNFFSFLWSSLAYLIFWAQFFKNLFTLLSRKLNLLGFEC